MENKIPKVGKVFASLSSRPYSVANMEDVIIGGIAHSIMDTAYNSPRLCKMK